MRHIVLIAHNVRSSHNVGSLLRTADGLGVEQVALTGYTPYPLSMQDKRLPHLAQKIDKQIHKTALGAELSVAWGHHEDINVVLHTLRSEGYMLAAVEQAENAIVLPKFRPPDKIAVLVGNEVTGIDRNILSTADKILEIPMFGKKESFNVVQAAAMALYHIRFIHGA